ncbi:MAG: hypothetical protein E6K82_11525 [Candidatus Rokuibacteriota bacterium]|nr:MAG: hypothetical protein E6K82_11525 [Candidatus Rokubacteria bacterium]
MTDDAKDPERAKPEPKPDQEDLLSPTRALRESGGASGGQRLGDNGPVANPEVSFPDDAGAKDESAS